MSLVDVFVRIVVVVERGRSMSYLVFVLFWLWTFLFYFFFVVWLVFLASVGGDRGCLFLLVTALFCVALTPVRKCKGV